MNRYFKLYRASMMRLAKMETILEEGQVIEPVLDNWKKTWHAAREYESYGSHWDQWVDIEYDEPSSPPPALCNKVTTAPL